MAIPSLAMIPSGYKDGKVYSVLPSNGDGDFNFTRASSAARVNKDGLIETVGSGIPRLDYTDSSCPSLLLEPQRTNLITYSEDFSNAAWTNSNAATIVNPIANLSPDGALSGNEFNEGNADARRGVYEDLTVVANTSYTLSVFVKKGTSDYLRLVIANGLDSGLDWTAIQVDLSNNSVSSKNGTNNLFTDISSSISDTNFNGYYRLQLTAKHPTTTTLRILFGMSDGVAIANSNSIARRDYVGANKYLYVWGAMLEQGSYATSYIPTSGSAVTRLADSCYQDNLLTDIINASYPFTMYAEAKAVSDNTQNFLTFGNRGATNQYFTLVLNNDGTIKLDARANGISENLASTASAISNGEFFKVAVSMESATSGKISVNGNLDSKTNFTQQSVNTDIKDLLIGQLRTISDTGQRIPISDVRTYNTALTDQELIALTTI